MGRRSQSETLSAIYQAFLERRTWSQADLAERVGIGVPALRKCLLSLEREGVQFQREQDHPHVYWSLPQSWFPGGILIRAGEVPDLVRHLGRLPEGPTRDAWLERLRAFAPPQQEIPFPSAAVMAPPATEGEQAYLATVEDAATRAVALHMRYFTVSRGTLEWRHASVLRVLLGAPARFAAVCHRDDRIKWFRVDHVLAAMLDRQEPFRHRQAGEVESFLHDSIEGFHAGSEPVACAFRVRHPEARWVAVNLPGPLEKEDLPTGMRFRGSTAGILPLARFVAGLGDAACAESPELRQLVVELATGTLNTHSVNSNGASG